VNLLTQSTVELNFARIRNNWTVLEKQFESTEYIRIENYLDADDSITIQKTQSKYRIRIKLELQLDDESKGIRFTSKVILLKKLGFVKENNAPEFISDNHFYYNYIKTVPNMVDVIDTINKLPPKFLNFKASIEMRENAPLKTFIDNFLVTLYPCQHELMQPKHGKVAEIVNALVEAFVQDRNYSECVNTDLIETTWGVRTARQIADLIKNTPEIVYRILKNPKTRQELLKFIELVPYEGPGRRASGIETGRAFRIKLKNVYIVEKLKELGVPQNVIFPGG
jgi:hypothetical protein